MTQYNDFAGTTIALSAVFLPLALIAVVLRIAARNRTRAKLGYDDMLAVLALAVYVGFTAMVIWGAENGGNGYDFHKLPLETLRIQLKVIYAATILAASIISIAKFSILMLYRRAFNTDKRFQLYILMVGIMCVAWWLGASLGAALRCTPVKSQFDPLVPGTCYNAPRYFIVVEILNCLLDFIIVAMPISVIQGLNLQLKHKITLAFIFLLGGFVGLISILRMALVYKLSGTDFNVQSGYWLQVQLSVAIVCICLPTLRPLVSRQSPFASKLRAYFRSFFDVSSLGTRWRSKHSESDDRSAPSGSVWKIAKQYKNLSEDGSDVAVLTSASAGTQSHKANDATPYPLQTIVVRTDVEIV